MKISSLVSRICVAVVLTATCFTSYAKDDPKADRCAVVTAGDARFTVLTPQLIRMEYSPDGKWEDCKTLTFVNRSLPVPKFTVKDNKSRLVIKTDALTLTYKKDGKPFDDKNLEVKFKMNGKDVVWHPGMDDTQNLMGTARTLDACDGIKFGREPMEKGLVSRAGWAIVDDSRNHLLKPDDSSWDEWVAARPDGERQDLYLFAYGHDYKKALSDYQKVAGRAPLPPKYTFGYWWSRYWQYSDNELVDVVDKIKAFDIPIDVLIVDMDWHDTFGLRSKDTPKDEYGQRIGWTGYTWQKQLFPNPANFLKWTENEDLKVALNLHPASGIQPYEECYQRFAKEYGWRDTTKSIPFKMDEKKWADTYFKTILEPMEKEGVDFWWLDWQQWRESKFLPGLSNTFWLNHTFFKHAKNRDVKERPFIYHRWGGLGSHRYPLGFSGDTYIKWSTLAFLPYFTSTASNVNYGYWGHDIGGHYFAKDGKWHYTDPELYLRWLQYGVFTPIFKTHSSKDMNIVRYPWAFPDHLFMMRDAIKQRYSLVPYIYNAARANYDTGVAMTRPMYYEYPELDKAYNVPEQFFLGDDILATVVASPVDSVTGLAERKMWFPQGRWYDFVTGDMIDGNQEKTLAYTLAENPFYVKAGAIIPMNPDNVKNLQRDCDTLVLTFIPGDDGALDHYEDDGVSSSYESDYAITHVEKNTDGNRVNVRIAARKGGYDGAPDARRYELRFPAMMPPASVEVNGVKYSYSRFPKAGEWTYDGYSLQPVVYTASLPVGNDAVVTLDYEGVDADNAALYGKKAVFNRCLALTPQFKEEQGRHGEDRLMLPQEYLKVSQCPNFILENPAEIRTCIKDFESNIGQLFDKTDEMDIIGDGFKKRLKAQLKR